MSLRFRKVWTGKYDGVDFEINNFELGDIDQWTFYLYIKLDSIPDKKLRDSFWLKPRRKKEFGNHIFYDYYEHPVIGNIEWHCGCTWYSKESGFDGDKKIIKIGCDYGHYWDEGKTYDLDGVLEDTQKAIRSFRRLLPEYKYWCCGNGKLYNREEGVLKDGIFHSEEYYGDRDWFKKLKAKELLEEEK